jgi:hypothetical protein
LPQFSGEGCQWRRYTCTLIIQHQKHFNFHKCSQSTELA